MGPPPFILALDIATNTGVAQGRPGETPRASRICFGEDGEAHAKVFARALREFSFLLTDWKPDVVYLEEPLPILGIHQKSNSRTIIRLNGLWAIAMTVCELREVRHKTVPVNDVRAAFIGKGRYNRTEAKRRTKGMCKMLGWAANNEDEADALAVWHFASSLEAPDVTRAIPPGMQRKNATLVGGVDIGGLFQG